MRNIESLYRVKVCFLSFLFAFLLSIRLVGAQDCESSQIIQWINQCSAIVEFSWENPDSPKCASAYVKKDVSQLISIFENNTEVKDRASVCLLKSRENFTNNENIRFKETHFGTFDIFFDDVISKLKIEQNDIESGLLWMDLGYHGYHIEEYFGQTIVIAITVNNKIYEENIAFEHFINGSQIYIQLPEEIISKEGEYKINLKLNPNALDLELNQTNNETSIDVTVSTNSSLPLPNPKEELKDTRINTVEEFNARGTFKIRPGIDPLVIEELSKIQNEILKLPKFNNCTNSIYLRRTDSPCGGGPNTVACVMPSSNDWIQASDELLSIDGGYFDKIAHVVWHELIHVCDYTMLNNKDFTPTIERENIVKSMGWENSIQTSFKTGSGYEEPFLRFCDISNRGRCNPEYSHVDSFEDLAVAQENVNPIFKTISTATSMSKPVRCRIIRDIFFGAPKDLINCGPINTYKILDLSDFTSSYLDKNGISFLENTKVNLAPASIFKVPEIQLDTFADMSLNPQQDLYTNYLDLPKGVYTIYTEQESFPNVTIRNQDTQKLTTQFFVDYNANGIQDGNNEVPISLKKESIKYKEISSIYSYNIKNGWNILPKPLLTNMKKQILTTTDFIDILKSHQIDLEYISIFKAGKWIIYTDNNTIPPMLDLKDINSIAIYSKNSGNLDILGSPPSLLDLKEKFELGWNIIPLSVDTSEKELTNKLEVYLNEQNLKLETMKKLNETGKIGNVSLSESTNTNETSSTYFIKLTKL